MSMVDEVIYVSIVVYEEYEVYDVSIMSEVSMRCISCV